MKEAKGAVAQLEAYFAGLRQSFVLPKAKSSRTKKKRHSQSAKKRRRVQSSDDDESQMSDESDVQNVEQAAESAEPSDEDVAMDSVESESKEEKPAQPKAVAEKPKESATQSKPRLLSRNRTKTCAPRPLTMKPKGSKPGPSKA